MQTKKGPASDLTNRDTFSLLSVHSLPNLPTGTPCTKVAERFHAHWLESLITNQKRNFWDNSDSKVVLPHRAPGRELKRSHCWALRQESYLPSVHSSFSPKFYWCLIFQQSSYCHCIWCYSHWRNTCLDSRMFQSQSWSYTSVCFAEKETNYRQLQSKRGKN